MDPSQRPTQCPSARTGTGHLYNRLLMSMLLHGVTKVTEDWRTSMPVKGVEVTDAKSLFDHLQTTGQVPSERQTMLDLMVARDMMEQGAYELKWVPTHRQHTDGLTKSLHTVLWEELSRSGDLQQLFVIGIY